MVEPGSLQLPSTQLVGGPVAQPLAQVVVLVPGSQQLPSPEPALQPVPGAAPPAPAFERAPALVRPLVTTELLVPPLPAFARGPFEPALAPGVWPAAPAAAVPAAFAPLPA